MKSNTIPRCPGCGKHCSASNPRCKYGRNYFEKKLSKEKDDMPKWKRQLNEGSVIWELLSTSRSIKKNLKNGGNEASFLSKLTDTEQQMLTNILDKLKI